MLSLVLYVALSQAKVGVVQSSNLGVAPKRAAELTKQLSDLLISEKLEPSESKTTCDSRPCLIARGRELGVPVVVSVAFAALGKDTVMDLECVQVTDGKSIGQTTFTAKTGDMKLPFEAQAFAADVYRALAAGHPQDKAAATTTDPPKETQPPKLTPEPSHDTPPQVVDSGSRSSAPAIGFGVAAGVSAIATAALLIVATIQTGTFHGADDGVHFNMPRSAAQSLSSSVNTEVTIALGTGIATGVFAVLAVLFGLV